MKQPKRSNKLSLAPLTPAEALSAALRIKPEDMAKLRGKPKGKKPPKK